MKKCVIVGAGIIGQLSALALYDRGLTNISILEWPARYPPASWAGGGILSPLFPWRYSDALNALCAPGGRLYDSLAARLVRQEGLDERCLHLSGMWTEIPVEERGQAEQWLPRWAPDAGLSSRFIGREKREGVWQPLVGSIRNPRFLKALRRRLVNCGICFISTEVSDWQATNCGGVDIHTSAGRLSADILILAAGQGLSRLLPEVAGNLFPAKGEMLLYRLGGDAPTSIVLTKEGYAIPRANGDTLIGSTHRAWDNSAYPTVEGRYQLAARANLLVPQVRHRKPDFHWAGVRPGNCLDRPIIAPLPGAPGVFVSGGHYRNGLVAAPASAELLAQLITGEQPFTDPKPYSLSSVSSSSRSSSSFFNR